LKLKSISKILESRFITRYDIDYETEDGRDKVYEMVSRDRNISSPEDLANRKDDAVIIVATDPSGSRILVNREFRLAVNTWVYNFPAGLMEDGEDPVESARRELREETGLSLLSVDYVSHSSYSAIGISNERNVMVVCTADGKFSKSTSDEEEIKAGWYSRDEIRKLLESEMFTARTQAYCYLWSRLRSM
jgi:ADP-ribose pyrophosphatase